MIRKLFDIWRAFVWWLKGPYKKSANVAVMLVLVLCLAACEEKKDAAASMQIAVVDVEKVLQESAASVEGRQHLGQAQKRLQEGWEQLQKTWANAPQKDKGRVLADGFRALNQQMSNEENAANRVVLQLMAQAVKEWRARNGAVAVIARQNLLDANDANDITAAIIGMMDKMDPKFADLPTVKVHEPKPREEAQPAAKDKK